MTTALYYDGNTSKPEAVDITFSNDSLSINTTKWSYDQIVLVEAWDGQKAIFGYRQERLYIHEKDLSTRLKSTLRYQKDRHSVNIKSLALWCTLGVSMIFLLYISIPKMAYWAAPHIPQPWLAQLGDNLQDGFIGKRKVCVHPAGLKSLDKLMQPLIKNAAAISSLKPEDVRVTVVHTKDKNAVALPGARMILFSGLIRQAASPEGVAGVMAHELSHAAQKHSAQALARVGSYLLLSEVIFPGSSILTLGVILSELSYSRSHEHVADVMALQILKKSQISPIGLSLFFQDIADQQAQKKSDRKRTVKLPNYLSTHPNTEKRAALFRTPTTNYRTIPILSEREWQDLRNICARTE